MEECFPQLKATTRKLWEMQMITLTMLQSVQVSCYVVLCKLETVNELC